MKEIKLTQGKVALVDDEDFEELNKHKWYARKCGNTYYASTHSVGQNKGYGILQMHREILKLKDRQIYCDHINHDGLDNQKHNLRCCTNAQNQHNQIPQGGTSKYKGVCWHKHNKKWRAQININGEVKNIGYYNNELDAARAYDAKAIELFGEFACTNNEPTYTID